MVIDLVKELVLLIISEHRTLQNESTQVGNIISDATNDLSVRFGQLNKLAEEQSEIVAESISTDEQTANHAGAIEKITNISRQTKACSDSAIHALQCEDIIQQLTKYTNNRAQQIELLFNNISSKLNQQDSQHCESTEDLMRVISDIQQCLISYQEILEKESPVKQASMQKGKVELF